MLYYICAGCWVEGRLQVAEEGLATKDGKEQCWTFGFFPLSFRGLEWSGPFEFPHVSPKAKVKLRL